MKTKHALLLLGLSILLSTVSCAGFQKGKRSAVFPPNLRHEVHQALLERNRRVASLKGLVSIQYGSKFLGIRGPAAIVLRPPSFLRVDDSGEFGVPRYRLAVSDGKLVVHWPTSNQYFRGLAGVDQMARYLRVPLNADSVVRLMAGVIPLEPEDLYTLKVPREGKGVILQGKQGEILVRRKGSVYLPREYILRDIDDSEKVVVTYPRYREENGFWFPTLIRASSKNPKSKFEIRYQQLDLNPSSIDQKVFDLEIPDNAERVQD